MTRKQKLNTDEVSNRWVIPGSRQNFETEPNNVHGNSVVYRPPVVYELYQVYITGGVYNRLYTPPALVRRTHLGWRCIQAPIYTTGACSPHTPRVVQKIAGGCRHGLGISWKLSWSRNGPVFQELWAPLKHFGICRPVVYMATHPCIHHRWCVQSPTCTTGARSPHTLRADQKTSGVCRQGLRLSWKLSWR